MSTRRTPPLPHWARHMTSAELAMHVWEWTWGCCFCRNDACLSEQYNFNCTECNHRRCPNCPDHATLRRRLEFEAPILSHHATNGHGTSGGDGSNSSNTSSNANHGHGGNYYTNNSSSNNRNAAYYYHNSSSSYGSNSNSGYGHGYNQGN